MSPVNDFDTLLSLKEEDLYGVSLDWFCEIASAGSWAECLTALLVSPQALLSRCPFVGKSHDLRHPLHIGVKKNQQQSLTSA